MFSQDLVWWITVVDLPALGGLFWLVWHGRKESENAIADLHDIVGKRHAQLREALSCFKLEVAKNYASVTEVRDLRDQLIGHLLRIESKLDTTAMKTEALRGERLRED